MSVEYKTFFRAATGLDGPFDYQCRLAEDPECKSRLINPEGIRGGKTAVVVVAPSNRSWTSGATASPTPKHRTLEHP